MAEVPVKAKPDTIVLIHGFWVTPRSWEHWKKYYEAKGYTVLTPAYPGFEVEVEALRADPTPIEQLQVPEIIDMLENMIGKLDRPPIDHGALGRRRVHPDLLDHGFGAVGVVIDSAPTEGVKVVPLSENQVRVPHPEEPANRHRAVGFTPEQWHYVFANTFSDEGLWSSTSATTSRPQAESSGEAHSRTSTPGRTTTTSTTTTTRGRRCCSSWEAVSPFPPKVGHSNVKHYKSKTVTEIVEFDGPHLLPAIDGWEEVADFALDWALKHAG